jgi:hypothetical protein
MMRWQRLGCLLVLACAVLFLTGPFGLADDKDKPALSGAWAKKGEEMRIEFGDKSVLKLFPHGEKAGIVVVCKYSLDKDGVVKAKITELEAKEDFKEKLSQLVPVGLEFSFKCKVKDNAATLEDVTGEKTDTLKTHLEGEYEKK